MDKLTIFVNRLKKIGIEVELLGNAPWCYLYKVCGKKVEEKYLAEWGFTIAFSSVEGYKLTEISEIFKILRKYARFDDVFWT